MKKFVLAALLAVVGVAHAGGNNVGLEYKFEAPRGSGANSQGYEASFGHQYNNNLGVDIRGENLYTNGNGENRSKIEAGVTPQYQLGNGFTVFARGAIGQRWVPGDNYTYYSVEPGVKYAVTPALGLRASYRFRDGFDSADNYLTRTWRIGADYSVTSVDTVFVGFDRAAGDSNYNGLSLGYKRGF